MQVIRKILLKDNTTSLNEKSEKLKPGLSNTLITLIFIFSCFLFPVMPICASKTNKTTPKKYHQLPKVEKKLKRENLERQEKEYQADLKTKQARTYFLKK